MTTSEQLLADAAAADLGTIEMATLRQLRTTCKEVETGLSYLRRLVQGRLDIVRSEITRRAEGGEPDDDLEHLIERLPALLAENTRSGGLGRLPQTLGTGVVDVDLAAELDEIAPSSTLGSAGSLPDEELDGLRSRLADFEHRVSALRKQFFGQIDALEAELTRRYRTGEATVDSLLH